MASTQTFAVIGAGVAGLQAAAQLKQAGYTQITVFEKSGDVGGVWQSNYAGYALQVRKWHYEIPGYKWPKEASHPKYPTGQEVQDYLRAYARDSGVLPLIKFNTSVTSVNPVPTTDGKEPGSEGWTIEYTDTAGKSHKETFGFVVVSNGLFNAPLHPEWAQGLVSAKPKDDNSLWIVDGKDYNDASVAKDKRVVVIGGGKTGHDVGLISSQVAKSTTILVRRAHWMAPQKVLGFIPLEFATYTRWSWALQPAYYASGKVKKTTHALFYPVKAAAWGLFGLIFPLQTGHPSKVVPKHLEGIYDTIGMVDSKKFSKAFKSGKLQSQIGEVKSVEGKKLILADGSVIEELREKAGYDEGKNQYIYRSILPPSGLSNIAFIGQHATFQHVLTTALQSRWLVDVLKGDIKLPSEEKRLADVAAHKAWITKFEVKRNNNYAWAQHGKYHDVLVKDIRGYTAAYSRWNVPAELFGYIYNQLYAPLFPGNQELVQGPIKPSAAVNGTNGVAA